jgi:hypothetical protein
VALRIDREHPLDSDIGYHSIVADNMRRWAKDEKIALSPDITNHDIMNVYHFLVRTGQDCDEDTVLAYLVAGVVAFGHDGSKTVPVNSKDQIVPWEQIKLPEVVSC